MPAPLAVAASAAAKAALKAAAKRAAVNTVRRAGESAPGGPWGALAILGGAALMAMVLVVSIFVGLLTAVTGASSAAVASQCDGAGIGAGGTPAPSAVPGIPATALDAYTKAAATTGIDWTYLAGIGKVESNHGSYGGATLQPDGTISPPIIGIPLNGSNGTMAIRDTDGGQWDGDTVWDRAVGPMQFIPSTWKTAGKDGNLDGVNDPNNLYDAILAAGFYLKAGGGPSDMRAAIYSYNRAGWYVDKVLAAAAEYRAAAGSAPVVAQAATTDQAAAPTGALQVALAAAADTAADPSEAAAASAWLQPLAAGSYHLSSRFGMRLHPIRKVMRMHNGLDYAAPKNTPVMSIGPGTVTSSGPSGNSLGTYVEVDHGTVDGRRVSSGYGHLNFTSVTAGQTVAAGEQLGGVGTTGGSTGDHLHLIVEVDGTPVDPEVFLASAGVATPNSSAGAQDCTTTPGVPSSGGGGSSGDNGWGGHQNGRIPAEEMCPIAFAPHQRLRCDAAESLATMNVAYQQRFGRSMAITDAYRTYESQVSLRRRKPGLAAVPGTSNHGWGLAVDFGGGINSFGTPQHEWMRAYATEFGWFHPSWAQQGGSKPEAWHWQFGNGS